MKDPKDCMNMQDIRNEIDNIDRNIISLLGQRYKYVKKASDFKKDKTGIKAPDRVKKMLATRRAWAEEEGLSPDLIEEIYSTLVDYFINEEMKEWESKIANLVFNDAELSDADEILALQKLAYKSEAEIYNDFNIPPLMQTLDEMKNDIKNVKVLKAVIDNKIIGSIRAYEKNGTCYIGRVIVHPDFQNRGIGKILMNKIEEAFSSSDRFELFTGNKSERNLYFYKKLGYHPFEKDEPGDIKHLVFLEKDNKD